MTFSINKRPDWEKSMSFANQFEDELLQLFHARTHQLKSYMWPTVGAAPQLTQKRVRKGIESLQSLAVADYLRSKDAKHILASYDHKRQWQPKRGKGFGARPKASNFKACYDKINTKNCVYAFWNGSRCLYVGRTLSGKGRPTSHFQKFWFGASTRIDIFGFDRKRDVPRFECMLTHRWEPVHSRVTPASKKYYSVCPVCAGMEFVEDQVKWLFRLR
jgi:hypothetical protein